MIKKSKISLKIVFLFVLMITLVGCSSGSDQSEIDQLMNANEELRKELEEAKESLSVAESRIEKLETTQNASIGEELSQYDITPPQLSPSELLVGEWFYQDFHEDGFNSWLQSIVFNEDGTGKVVRTFYLPRDIIDYSTSDPSGDISLGFSWSLDGETLHTIYDDGKGFVDYTFSSMQQQLIVKNENGNIYDDDSHMYVRGKPSISEEYIEKELLLQNLQEENSIITRNFLGNWYFDVLIWSFNSDGTGVIDIPELGDQPASKRNFSYTVTGNETNLLLTMNWSDSETSFFWPTINNDGSITLTNDNELGEIKLTRTFDLNNCPISNEIIENGMGVLSGSMFSEILQ